MCNKKVCKYCSKLEFYDWYLCRDGNVCNSEVDDFHLGAIETTSCGNFEERTGPFWNYPGAEF